MWSWKRRRGNRRKMSPEELGAQRRERLRGAARAAAPWLLVLAVLGALGALVAVGWERGLRLELFMVEGVDIEGAAETTRAEVEGALRYRDDQRYLFGLDLPQSKKRLEALPWVAVAEVERAPLDRVKVRLQERRAAGVAFIGRLMLVDEAGVPFKEVDGDGLDLPIVTGLGDDPGALTEREHARIRVALEVMSAYQRHNLDRFERLSEVEVDPRLGLTLVTETRGIRVMLGEGQVEERLARLEEVFSELERRKVRVSSIRLDGERSLRHIPLELARQTRDAPQEK